MKEILFTSSVLIGVILLARRLFRGKVSHTLLYAAWLLVAARLLIPFQFGQWDMSIATLTHRMEAQSQTVQQAQELLQEPVSGPSRQEVYQQLTQEYTQQGLDPARPEVQEEMLLQMEERLTAPTLSQVLTVVWAAGAAVMAVWFFTVNLVFLRKAKQGAVPYPTNLPVRVRISAHVPTPCLVGLFRPVIYLTPECVETPAMARHVLTHELTHLRHRDPFWSLVRCACLCVYWFDPLVWIAAAQSRRDCELACDEGALRVLGNGERIAYGQTLLVTVSRSLSPARLLQTATAMSESKKQLKERVCFIVKKPKNLLIAVICFLLIAALTAGCAFTGGITEPPNTTGPTETTPPPETKPEPTQPTGSEPTEPVPEYTFPAPKDLVFTEESPQEAFQGTWMGHVLPSIDGDRLSYTLTLKMDGTVEYSWGIYGSDLGEILVGTWKPAGKGYGDNEYSFELHATGGSWHEDGVQPYEHFSVYRLQRSEDGSAISANWVDGTPLFHYSNFYPVILYKYENDSQYYDIPIISQVFDPVGNTPSKAESPLPNPEDLKFQENTPRKEVIGEWFLAERMLYDHISYYSLTLNHDGTAEYEWGEYRGEPAVRMEGTWRAAGGVYGETDYILELAPTGGSRYQDGAPPFQYYGVYDLKVTKDGKVLRARLEDGSPLFHFYDVPFMTLYKFTSEEERHEAFDYLLEILPQNAS